MSISQVSGVRIAGIASAVPRQVIESRSLEAVFGADEIPKVIKGTGVERRRVVPDGMCASDLCYAAGRQLLAETGCDPASVDSLIFVSQSHDYLLPATSCLLQDRLGLPVGCPSFDIALGCSGYIYGLWTAAGLIASGLSKRCLLAVGEVSTRRIGPRDRSAAMLFGDAGTATLLERSEPGGMPWTFSLGTDGSGGKHLIVPAGGSRLIPNAETGVEKMGSDGNPRRLDDLYMNGTEIFLFTLNRVPKLVKEVRETAGLNPEAIDAYVFHQANEFMLKHLAKNMQLPPEKVPLILRDFGNTSSASIPLTITQKLREPLQSGFQTLLLGGFGVGLSWGAVTMQAGPMVIPDLIEVDESVIPAPLFSRN